MKQSVFTDRLVRRALAVWTGPTRLHVAALANRPALCSGVWTNPSDIGSLCNSGASCAAHWPGFGGGTLTAPHKQTVFCCPGRVRQWLHDDPRKCIRDVPPRVVCRPAPADQPAAGAAWARRRCGAPAVSPFCRSQPPPCDGLWTLLCAVLASGFILDSGPVRARGRRGLP